MNVVVCVHTHKPRRTPSIYHPQPPNASSDRPFVYKVHTVSGRSNRSAFESRARVCVLYNLAFFFFAFDLHRRGETCWWLFDVQTPAAQFHHDKQYVITSSRAVVVYLSLHNIQTKRIKSIFFSLVRHEICATHVPESSMEMEKRHKTHASHTHTHIDGDGDREIINRIFNVVASPLQNGFLVSYSLLMGTHRTQRTERILW